jgi:hypothetical protein
MEIVFLLAGLAFIAVGGLIIAYEIRERSGTEPVAAHVIGFSTGRSNNPNSPSFHSVAEYQSPNGNHYYVEGAVGSSAPLHHVGDAVTVLVNPTQPEKALLRSSLSFLLGAALALMGLVCVTVFWITFHMSVYSAVMGAIIVVAAASKIRGAWRKQPLSWEAWREYKRQIFAPRVFTEESKGQIKWADPMSLQAAVRYQRKANRFGVPVLLLCGVGLLLLSHHFYVKTETFLAKANQTTGRVVDLHETDSSDSSPTYAPVVEYHDGEGRAHTFTDSFSSSPPSYRTGENVAVLYNRENPGEAQIDRGRANHLLTIVFGCLGVLFASGAVYAAAVRKS